MSIRTTALAAMIAGLCLPAAAAPLNFDFGDLQYKNGQNTGFLPGDGVKCTGGDLCSSDVDHGQRSGDLTYSAGGVTVHATGLYNGGTAAVVQDHDNFYDKARHIGAGLGVYHRSHDNADDNITAGETLTLTFDRVVTITGVGLRAEGHNTSNWLTGATFLLDGQSVLLPKGSGDLSNLSLTGKSFTFAYGGAKADQFYLSSLTLANPVPEPASAALMLAGLGALGLGVRRRRPA